MNLSAVSKETERLQKKINSAPLKETQTNLLKEAIHAINEKGGKVKCRKTIIPKSKLSDNWMICASTGGCTPSNP
jgi:hypothetical protein